MPRIVKKERQRCRPPRDRQKKLPFDEQESLELLRKWNQEGDRQAYSQLFTNFAKVIDGVIGYFVNRGILWEGEHDDFKQDTLMRMMFVLHTYDPKKGRLYSFVYGNSQTHIRLLCWNESRKYGRVDYIHEERTMEMLLGSKIFAPHIGMDLVKFIRDATRIIKDQCLYFEKDINRGIRTYMIRLLARRDREVNLPEKYRAIALVRYRIMIARLLNEHFPDGTDSYYNVFRQFFQ